MANHKSAEKRNRQRVKRRQHTLNFIGPMRTLMKRVRKALADRDVAAAKNDLASAVKAIGRAASSGVIHRNTASRYVSRLTKAVNQAQSA